MIYIKIGNEKYPAKIHSFTTQHGQDAIRVISDTAPVAEDGFLIVDENDNLISDKSSYVYLYREDDKCKEYTEKEENIIQTENFEMGDLPESTISILSKRISTVNNKVDEITPYEETKKAYYGEIEKVFYNVPEGNISLFFSNYKGDYDITRFSNRVVITFPQRIKDITTITLMVQK